MRARQRLRGFIFLAAFGLGFGALLPAAEALDVEYFKKQIEPYRKLPEFVAPGPPFDARKCMQGKSILTRFCEPVIVTAGTTNWAMLS